jgi:membrane protein required for colicin V production
MTPHALDISVAVIILLSTLSAYFRGIVREFFMLAGLALASFVAVKAGHLLVPDVSQWMNAHPESNNEKASVLGGLLTPTIATNVISYGGIFLGVFIIMIIIRMMISHWVSGAGLTVADRVGGAIFGFIRGFLLVLIVFATCLYMAYAGATDQLPDWAKNSVSVPILESALAWTDRNIDLKGSLKTVADKIEHVDFDKVKKDAGNAQSDLNAEVKHEENAVQKAVDTPAPAPAAAPVAPVTSAPMTPTTMTPATMPATTPATNPGPVPDLAPPPAAAAPAPAAAGKATP